MRKVITMVLYNRPEYTKVALDALSRCDGIGEYRILAHVEPGSEDVLSLIKAADFTDVDLVVNTQRLGIGRNTYLAWEHGFNVSEFVIHIEDDTIPARDCLRYMEYGCHAYVNDQEIFSIASYNRSACPPSHYYTLGRRPGYTCWLVGCWRNRWDYIKDHWSPHPARYATHLHQHLAKHQLQEVYPLLSRSQNIGAEGGMHVPSAEWHHKHHHTEHWAGNCNLIPGKYVEMIPSHR